MAFIIDKDSYSDSKTTCFTMSDSSDRKFFNITRYNILILSKLEAKVID